MLCSSCGAECADDMDTCASCGASLKSGSEPEPAAADSVSEVPVQPVRKKPIKLDIAAILAEDPVPVQDTSAAVSAPDPITPESPDNTGCAESEAEADTGGAAPDDQRPADIETPADEAPVEPINPTEVLLLSLCILLGLGILAMVVLIIWPTIIPVLFYHG